MLSFCSKLLGRFRRSVPGRSYKPKSERCDHSHPTVGEAVQCAVDLNCAPDIVAIRKGRAEVLTASEQRICEVMADYLVLKRDAVLHESQASTLRRSFLTPKSNDQSLQPLPDYKRVPRKPLKNRYKCPYGKKSCGDNANYCSRCNEDYAEFLKKIDEHG